MTNTLAYSTTTPLHVDKGHRVVVEMEADTGYRSWSSPMWESNLNAYVESFPGDYMLSDVDHASNCWCGQDRWSDD